MMLRLALSLPIILAASAAQAYLLPLVGAGGVILTALAGLIAVLFSAGFLILFKLRRALARRRKPASPDEP